MTQDNQKYILSIDLGTSGSKTAIVSIHGEVVDFDFESVPLNGAFAIVERKTHDVKSGKQTVWVLEPITVEELYPPEKPAAGSSGT